MTLDSVRSSQKFGFVIAALALTMIFAASAAPIPLYGIYRTQANLTNTDLSLTAVAYFIGAISALLFFGRLSNFWGRRAVAVATLLLMAGACVLLLQIDSLWPLLTARIIQGLACGLASSNITAMIADNAPAERPAMTSTVTSSAPMVGLTIGAITSGTLVDYIENAAHILYAIVMVCLIIGACLILATKETQIRKSGAFASLRPRLALPPASKALFPVAGLVFVATWSMGGFYQSFAPSIAADQLHSKSSLIAALVFASYMAPTIFGGPAVAKISSQAGQKLGTVAFGVALTGLSFSLWAEQLIPYLLFSTAAGVAQGAALSSSIRGLIVDALPQEKAGIFAAIFATSYTGAAVPSLIAGQLSKILSLSQISIGYVALAIVTCVVVLTARPTTSARAEHGQ